MGDSRERPATSITMDTEEIRSQINRAAVAALRRVDPNGDANSEIIAVFMSGLSQGVNFLVRAEGDVTPQQLDKAIKLAGEDLGLLLKQP